jgi:metal-sulfur cluster biosynthetic enzyme
VWKEREANVSSAESVEKANIVGETPIEVAEVFAALREVYDPEIPVNILDLGLIFDLTISGTTVDVTMTLTAIGCPVAGEVMADVESRVGAAPNVEKCTVTLTFEPQWTPDRMTEDARWELGIG